MNGVADPIQSVLEAGTAVMVDKYGQPVVKCYCGNPLTAPVAYKAPVYTGPVWNGFDTNKITIINQSVTVINSYNVYDPTNNMSFNRTPGVNGTDGPFTGPGATPGPNPVEHPSVSLSPNPVVQGSTVTLTATGYTPSTNLQVTVTEPGGGVEHYSAVSSGSGDVSYTLSNVAGNAALGTYTVTVTDTATGTSASASLTVQSKTSTSTAAPSTSPSTTTSTSSPATTSSAATGAPST